MVGVAWPHVVDALEASIMGRYDGLCYVYHYQHCVEFEGNV